MRQLSVIALASCLAAASFGASAVRAEDENGGAPGDWLARYESARTVGLGGAFVATPDEPMGVVWNPAGLSLLYQHEARFETARLFEGTSLYGASFAVPNRTLPSIGITVLAMQSGDFERTSELNEPLGTFTEGDMAVLLSASKSITPQFAVGANIKVIRQTVEEFGATGVGGDLGLLYDITPSIRVGASYQNLGGPNLKLRDTQETYAGHLRGGLAVRLFDGKGLLSTELDQSSGRGLSLHAGTEYWLFPQVGLRLGFDDNAPAGGMSYRFPSGLQFDYGLIDHDLGMTHRVGVSFRFGGFHATSQADPSVFSPLGQQSVTKFHLKARTKAGTSDWALDITDKSGQLIRRFGGKGTPPAHVMWDGKDEAGLPLPDGSYWYTLIVHDDEGREIASRERAVEITTGGPQGTVPVAVN